MFEGFQDGGFGDFVEHHALHGLARQQLLGIEDFAHMPGDGFPFAIRVSGQIEAIGAFERVDDFFDLFGRARVDFPIHGEVFVGAHGTVFGRQIADVAIARQHLEIISKVFVDGLGLCG